MTEVIGVRFRAAGKIYYFSPKDISFQRGDHAIVETARGTEYGFVVLGNTDTEDAAIFQPLKPVIRKATSEDDARHTENEEKEKEAFRICKEKIQKHALEMKLIDVEYTFDRGKILFYFTADGRVDFRLLVKDLASIFRTRIELRQVGVRDETKILGGYGVCGRPLCCHTFLSEFAPVSIKMAKEQGLSLNPTNISGVCGRLMCCLKNEEDVYEFLNSKLPSTGDLVTTPDGLKGEVSSVSVLNQKVKVIVSLEKEDEKELREYKASELKFKPHRKATKSNNAAHEKNHEKNDQNDDSILESQNAIYDSKIESIETDEPSENQDASSPDERNDVRKSERDEKSGVRKSERDGKDDARRSGRNGRRDARRSGRDHKGGAGRFERDDRSNAPQSDDRDKRNGAPRENKAEAGEQKEAGRERIGTPKLVKESSDGTN